MWMSLWIKVVIALVTATLTSAAVFGSNYVVPAEINNELQQTYILPASKYQKEYVALPVSVVNTYKSTELSKNTYLPPVAPKPPVKATTSGIVGIGSSEVDLSESQKSGASSQVQLPASISSLLEKTTQQTIQNTVQKIMQKTVVPFNPPKASELSSNTNLPPVEKTKVGREQLPEKLDNPPKTVVQSVKLTTQAPITVPKVVVTPTPPKKVASIDLRGPEFIGTRFNVDTASKGSANIISKATQKKVIVDSSASAKVTDLSLSDILHNSTPPKGFAKPVEPVKLSQRIDASTNSGAYKVQPLKVTTTTPKPVKVPQPVKVSSSIPSVTVQKTLNVLPVEPVRVISGTSSGLATVVNKLTENSSGSSSEKALKGSGISSISPIKPLAPSVSAQASGEATKASSKVEIKTVESKPVTVDFSQRIDTSSEEKASSKANDVRTTSPQATIRQPPSLWSLPKVIDIVQKTIKSSVNSNLTPAKDDDLELAKIFPGSPNGPENHYLPPEEGDLYENVEVFTPEGYKTERRLKKN